METLKMTQALDEKGFLYKKIANAIDYLNTIAIKRKSDKSTRTKLSAEDFEKKVTSDYQSIVDNIDRYNRLSRAIIRANSEAIITVNGIDMTRAEAISLRTQLKDRNCLEVTLLRSLQSSKARAIKDFDDYKRIADEAREKYTNNMIAANGAKDKKSLSDDDIMVIDKLVEPLEPEMIDPINIDEAIEKLEEKYNDLLAKLETAIKISNATTDVSF